MPLKSERLYEPQVGDTVRVVVEGEVNYVSDNLLTVGDYEIEKPHDLPVEKLEPPVETFKPGDVVRGKTVPRVKFLIVKGGYVDLLNNIWNPDPTDFTSRDYERVRLEEAPF